MLKAEIVAVRLVVEGDDDPDLSWLEDAGRYEGLSADETEKYMAQDTDRLEEYAAGGWCMVGIYAMATVRFATDQGGWIGGPTVRSGGLWGIESDSGRSYVDEVGANELADLADQLEALGFGAEAIAEAFANADRPW